MMPGQMYSIGWSALVIAYTFLEKGGRMRDFPAQG
jgi:hypothetical protein